MPVLVAGAGIIVHAEVSEYPAARMRSKNFITGDFRLTSRDLPFSF
jgi:hypothetical protein